MWYYLFLALFVPGFLTYIVQHLICSYFYKTQNLKKRYNAEWALVTGASSGIGKSIATRLARQGLNVVLVALGDNLLDTTFEELKAAYPKCQFRKVAADLGGSDYLAPIVEATSDIKVQIVFNNAGYLLTGFFHTRRGPNAERLAHRTSWELPLDALMKNLNCNAVSGVQITHHFVRQLISTGARGCVVFTSSAAAAMPSPFSVQYAATKSFISVFGASLAPEVKPYGIDVLVFHPSPVASRFYDKAHKLDALDFFKRFAVNPDELPDTVFASIGRTVWRDVGPTALAFRMLTKVIDYNFLSTVIAAFGRYMPDFKRASADTIAPSGTAATKKAH
ncbi:hypothetical protein GPECTOR_5g304 [Gonium pectorale]|uniref:Uncharacterized protein n=1 Tax=Gonium pectorale TaxID=33097 RepID=A0A150GX02_GONPE|nr:hypothetical protein GPECTOR_5g304 [Gonium pectorale]|eukprot:KXZ54212.1 hypothetical protein GPECTOR_5g304 [Gonium pectorale]